MRKTQSLISKLAFSVEENTHVHVTRKTFLLCLFLTPSKEGERGRESLYLAESHDGFGNVCLQVGAGATLSCSVY